MSSHHPQLRLSVPARLPFPSASTVPSPFPTPSKSKRRPFSSSPQSLPSLFLLLCSLRSLYSLLPFLRSSSPSFSLFPFSFLVSLLSLLSTSLLSPSPLPLPSSPLLRPLLLKSLLLALVFLLRFQGLRSCGTAATILAEFSGSLAARSALSSSSPDRPRRLLGSLALLASFLLLAHSWDRIGCSPLSAVARGDLTDCRRFVAMLLPFLSGFLGFHERSGGHWTRLRQLGRKKVRIFCLWLTTAMLFPPAVCSLLWGSHGDDKVSVLGLGWPLVNTVVFGVVLGENNGEEKGVGSGKDLQKEFLITFFCTLVLELFYFPQLSLPGFLLCGLLIWIAVRQLVLSSCYVELGSGEESESLYSMIRNPVLHILRERKSRKIALFLLINTAYMVVEFVAGFMSNSLGLISDACHMLFDCAALAIGLYASYISRLPANGQFNYGRGRVEVLSGYVNAVFLVLVGALIVLESLERILDPQDISTNSLLTVSVGGLLVNLVGLVFFHEEHHHAHGGSGCSHSHAHSDAHSHKNCGHDHHDHSHADVIHGHDFAAMHSAGSSIAGPHDHHHHMVHNEVGFSGHASCGHGHNHDQHCHGSGNQDHSHDNLVHEHNSAAKHNAFISVNGPHDRHHAHSCHDHDHHNHGSHKVSHNEVGFSGHDSFDLGHDHGHHCHAVVHDNTSSFAEFNHVNHEISFGNLHSQGQDGHTHEKIHDGSSCCGQHNSQQLSVRNSMHSHSSQSKELTLEKKGIEKQGKHHHIDHNMEGIFLHVLADTMGSVGVVISTLLIKYKGWLVADPACSIFISIMIVSSVLPLLRNSAEILMQRVSRTHEQDLKVALDEVLRVNGVCGIHNVHVWNFTNTEIVGTLHLQVLAGANTSSVKKQVSNILHDIGVKDLTIQLDIATSQQ